MRTATAVGILAVLGVLGPLSTTAQEPEFTQLVWPARAEAAMTSAFGDYRSDHVHAGLDIKTWGRVGVPVLAVADGRVSRVRTSPWGYGKALYVELIDGRMAVYAHLDRFIPELEDLVWDHQQRNGQYSVDIWLEKDEFPIRAGRVIAYSGVTGTSAPHLHFELRDRENAPVNPLRAGLSVSDSTPPTIQYLVIRPVGPDSRLEGDVRVRRFGVRRQESGRYVLRGRPEVEGNVALSLVVHDLMDGVWNRFGPYRLQLEIDGDVVFEVVYDRFTYDVSGYVELDRDYGYMVREGIRAHTLHRREGNALTFYGDYPEGAGYLSDLAPGIHTVTVAAEDAFGNESRLSGEILVNQPLSNGSAPTQGEALSASGDGTLIGPRAAVELEIEQYEAFLILSASTDRVVTGNMTFTVEQIGLSTVEISGRSVSDTRYRAAYPLRLADSSEISIRARFEDREGRVSDASTTLDRHSLPAAAASDFTSENDRMELSFPAGTFYFNSFLSASPAMLAVAGDESGLAALSDLYVLGPEDIQFRGSGQLRLQIDALPEGMEDDQVALYTRYERNGSPQWIYLGGELTAGRSGERWLEYSIGGFGPFAAMADTARPVVELQSPRDGAILNSRRPRIEFRVEDDQSGISDERQLILRLNGAQVIAQYDPQRDRLIHVPRFELDPGEYYLTLDVTDDAGNLTRHASRFTIR